MNVELIGEKWYQGVEASERTQVLRARQVVIWSWMELLWYHKGKFFLCEHLLSKHFRCAFCTSDQHILVWSQCYYIYLLFFDCYVINLFYSRSIGICIFLFDLEGEWELDCWKFWVFVLWIFVFSNWKDNRWVCWPEWLFYWAQELEKKRKEKAHLVYERKKQLNKLRVKAEKVADEKLGSQLDILAPVKY